jgi:hypothetical protein
VDDPTAAQLVVDGQETPLSALSLWAGLGVSWIDQLVPFHRSANVTCGPFCREDHPTAVQAVLDTHDTALRRL